MQTPCWGTESFLGGDGAWWVWPRGWERTGVLGEEGAGAAAGPGVSVVCGGGGVPASRTGLLASLPGVARSCSQWSG